jgi:hypothetical protein
MSVRLFFAALAIIAAITSSTHATTFDVHGTMQTLPVTGTIDIDTATGLVTAANVVAGEYTFPILYYQANFLVFGFYSNEYYALVRSTNSPSSYYSIIAIETAQNPGSLVSYTGGPFEAFIGYEASGVGGYQGTLTLPVPGPIIGAGLPGIVMAIAGFIGWRRIRRAVVA